jgi:hypothetical protein
MPDPLAGLPPRYLRTPEAARFLGLSGRTLEKHRTYGTGSQQRQVHFETGLKLPDRELRRAAREF